VLLAGDGATGLSLARTEHPDAILLDLRMPGLDGLDALRVLRQQARTAEIPVLLITPDANEEMLAAGRRAGAAEVLRKPFHPPELLQGVQALLAHAPIQMAV
jgi:DNA-binding response OmpR family regulator